MTFEDSKMLRYLPLLLIMLHGNLLFTQDPSLAPSLTYHIQSLRSYQPLPELTWLLKEGDLPLSVEDLMAEDIKDATLVSSTSGKLGLESPANYWFKIHLSSSVPVVDWLLFFQDTVRSMGWGRRYEEGTVVYIEKQQIRSVGRTGS